MLPPSLNPGACIDNALQMRFGIEDAGSFIFSGTFLKNLAAAIG
ncbi:hypothetical protein [Novosphingobium terrae]|nr:hypothetical protein [Novosphingobium terrae]